MLGGCDRIVSIGVDGRIEVNIVRRPTELEANAAQDILVKASGSPFAPVRAAAAGGLGKLLAISPALQLPDSHPVIYCLAALLNDANTEVACSAALALGNCAAASGMQHLVQRLESNGQDSVLAAVLTALRHAESIARQLDAATMGSQNWDLRRQSFERLRVWANTHLLQSDPTQFNDLSSAAALRFMEMLAPLSESNSFSESLCMQLEQSQQKYALEVAAEFRSRTNKDILQRSAMTKTLCNVAGPQWQLYNFTIAHALLLLNSKDPAENRAALWRLGRPGTISADVEFEHDAIQQVAEHAMTIAKSSPYAVMRRLAVDALYCEHSIKNSNLEKSTWRLAAASDVALDVFINDFDPGVQLAAANALGPIAGPDELGKLTPGINSRSSDAAQRLLRALVQRNGCDATTEPYYSQLKAFIEQLSKSADPALASLASWASMKDPGFNLAQRIRLARSFKAPAQRVSAVRALSEIADRRFLQPEMLSVLLNDPSVEVRVEVFATGLPEFISAPVEYTRLVLHGLSDPDENVQLAALKFRKHSRIELRQELKSKLTSLSETGTPKVRTSAAELLHKRREQ